jgi:CDP-diacylglycerol--serine O-phosphatidyltransferase
MRKLKFINNKKHNDSNELPISRLFPSIITLLSLGTGLCSIRYALDQKWEISVTLIIIAAFLDAMDGRVARLLNATSNFGAYLDSLADFLNFGIAPAIILYLWKLHDISAKGVAWGVVVFYVLCCAIRLARYNGDLDLPNKPAWHDKFFVGIPSTASGFLVMVPLMISFEYPNYQLNPILIASYVTLLACLMASRIPTFSSKKITISRRFASFTLVVVGLFISLILIEPWRTLPVIGLVYLLMIPISIITYNSYKSKQDL